MDVAGQQRPQPEVHIRADAAVAYRRVAEVMADASRAGLTRIGFVSDPREER
jgi:biopolymer transport protein ExbD